MMNNSYLLMNYPVRNDPLPRTLRLIAGVANAGADSSEASSRAIPVSSAVYNFNLFIYPL